MSQAYSGDIVITGIGLMSSIGIGEDAFWESVEGGQCGFRRAEHLSHVGTPDCIGGEVTDFTAKSARKTHLAQKHVKKQIKVMCREIQLGVASALQAVQHAGIEPGSMPAERIGVDFGANLMSSPPDVLLDAGVACKTDSSAFSYDRWGNCGDDRFKGMEPLWLLRYLPNMPGCHIGIAVDARGPNNSITHDEASGGLVLSEAANIIRRGRADVMITGTTGTRLHAVKSCQHTLWDTLADGPVAERCRPLDKDRRGEVLAESACTFILESRTHAEARGATILATLLGTAASCVLDRDGQANEQLAIERAATAALQRAGVSAAELGHVNVGASGHLKRDRYESSAIRTILADSADSVPVTAPKSYLGSAGSGSPLSEMAVSILGLRHGIVPKTLNFRAPDEEAPLNVVGEEHLVTDNRLFLKTNVTRMGQSSAVVIGV
ncbi:MAG: beta-ketoacyl-[acyl-carrier-protein] synthase family protein [Fuerstiella sp.]|nr:beta-ketoacyl-[acyl-carrier-protein] synthase family protein [Fuerstiella sp.]MCP4859075.1 beta-ketoacyl-[acyl-carrier-protein] synthase family protein [Fuerstiella sp.]